MVPIILILSIFSNVRQKSYFEYYIIELFYFKLFHEGITEILEKHSLELDQPANNTLKENRHPKKHVKYFVEWLYYNKCCTLRTKNSVVFQLLIF